MTVRIVARAGGCEFLVRAKPKAGRDAVLGIQGDALVVAVAAPPEDGKANAAVERTVAEWLGLARSRVNVVSGTASRTKKLRVEGAGAADLEQALARAAAPGAGSKR